VDVSAHSVMKDGAASDMSGNMQSQAIRIQRNSSERILAGLGGRTPGRLCLSVASDVDDQPCSQFNTPDAPCAVHESCGPRPSLGARTFWADLLTQSRWGDGDSWLIERPRA
jgi:hypothetical protein